MEFEHFNVTSNTPLLYLMYLSLLVVAEPSKLVKLRHMPIFIFQEHPFLLGKVEDFRLLMRNRVIDHFW